MLFPHVSETRVGCGAWGGLGAGCSPFLGGSVRRGRGDAACYVVVRESRGTPRQVGSSGTRVLSSIGYCAPPRYLIGARCYWNMSSSLNGSDAMSVSNALLFSPTRPNLTTISSWAAPSHRAVAAGLHRCTVSHCWASTLRRANGRPPSWSRSWSRPRSARIFEILKSRIVVSVSRYNYREAGCEARRRVGYTGKDE